MMLVVMCVSPDARTEGPRRFHQRTRAGQDRPSRFAGQSRTGRCPRHHGAVRLRHNREPAVSRGLPAQLLTPEDDRYRRWTHRQYHSRMIRALANIVGFAAEEP
jgi:hypothetical protein